jgi:hypothetical protein
MTQHDTIIVLLLLGGMAQFFMTEELLNDFEKELKDIGYFRVAK